MDRAIYVCDTCHRIFFNKEVLRVHLILRHKANTSRKILSITCPGCNKQVRHNSIWYHWEIKGVKSVSACTFCLKKIGTRKALHKHVQKCHKPYFKCETCAYETTKRLFFERHLQNIHTTTTQNVAVSNCWKYFTHNIFNKWQYSVQYVHNGLQLYGMLNICVFCREICRNYKEMEKHIVSNHMHGNCTKVEKVRQCTCGETFSNNILLKHHVFKLEGSHKIVEETNAAAVSTSTEDSDKA